MYISFNFALLFVFSLLLMFLLFHYFKHMSMLRNEAEYRDVVEYQTMLIAALLVKNPGILATLNQIRYFPDQSGFFVVYDVQGKLLTHGDFNCDISAINDNLSLNMPTSQILEVAKNGGGYVQYNYKGYVYDTFVYNYTGSPYIVCSGLYNDPQHIQYRMDKWKRSNKSLLKTNVSQQTLRKKV